MTARQPLRSFAVAALSAGALVALPALQTTVLARDNACTPADCGTHTCSYHGRTYGGGETIVATVYGSGGTRQAAFMCDGFTGRWVEVGTALETGNGGSLEVNGTILTSETPPLNPVAPGRLRTAP